MFQYKELPELKNGIIRIPLNQKKHRLNKSGTTDWTSWEHREGTERAEQVSGHYDAAPGEGELPNLKTEMQEEPPLVTFNLKFFFQWWPKSSCIISVMTEVMTW